MSVDKQLRDLRNKAYRSMGLSVTEADFDSRRDQIRRIAQEAGVDAWDLEVAQFNGGYLVRWDLDSREGKGFWVEWHCNDGMVRQKAIAATNTYVNSAQQFTPSGRRINTQHLASDEAIQKFAGIVGAPQAETQLDRIESMLKRLVDKHG